MPLIKISVCYLRGLKCGLLKCLEMISTVLQRPSLSLIWLPLAQLSPLLDLWTCPALPCDLASHVLSSQFVFVKLYLIGEM